jgi:hypothetical protein
MGAKVSVCTHSSSVTLVMMVGSTKLPGRSSAAPPVSTLPPCAFASSIAPRKRFTAAWSLSGPISVVASVGSPILPSTCL